MPASRSRTENWRRTLQQVADRNGTIEIAIPRPGDQAWPDGGEKSDAINLVWRVRLLAITDEALIIDEPSTMGQRLEIRDDIVLVAVFSLGQNRWMFRTRTMGRTRVNLNRHKQITGLMLKMPADVERCQRRAFYRVSTAGLSLPNVQARPLLDMSTATPAETASQTRIEMMRSGELAGSIHTDPLVLPEVGPPTTTTLVNLGGGGAGLVVDSDEAGVFDQHRVFWLTMDLQPHIPAPLCVVAKLAHIRMDSEQRRYLGMAFEFSHNPPYRKFVVDTLCRYVNDVQREQLRRRAENE